MAPPFLVPAHFHFGTATGIPLCPLMRPLFPPFVAQGPQAELTFAPLLAVLQRACLPVTVCQPCL